MIYELRKNEANNACRNDRKHRHLRENNCTLLWL